MKRDERSLATTFPSTVEPIESGEDVPSIVFLIIFSLLFFYSNENIYTFDLIILLINKVFNSFFGEIYK